MKATFTLGLVGCSALVLGFAVSADAAQVPLTPASVIGGSGSYAANPWDASAASGQFNGSKITNNNITEPVGSGGSGNEEWLGPEGASNQYLVIDLGTPTLIGQINLFNTHNGQYGDSGTQNFHIDASNSVSLINATVDFDLSGTITTILSGTLSDTTGQATIIPDVFVLDPSVGPYQYLRFVAEDFRSGDTRVGLNEIQVFPAVPEPSSCLLTLLGVLGIGSFRRRRAVRSTSL